MGDVPTQLTLLKEFKAAEQIRYIGVTTTSSRQNADLEAIIQPEPLDFIGIDYANNSRAVEERILLLAQDRALRCWYMHRSAGPGYGSGCEDGKCSIGRQSSMPIPGRSFS